MSFIIFRELQVAVLIYFAARIIRIDMGNVIGMFAFYLLEVDLSSLTEITLVIAFAVSTRILRLRQISFAY